MLCNHPHPRRRPLERRADPRCLARVACAALLAAFALLAPAPSSHAASNAETEQDTRFLIESITVENARLWSEELVVRETRLRVGSEYSERQIAAAVDRAARLPMIIAAESSLRRGSRRERYELVIHIEEARGWFFRFDGRHSFWSEEISVNGLTTTQDVDSGSVLGGYRRPVGRRGLFFAALSGGEGVASLGYSHFDLWGRGALLSVSLSVSDCNDNGRRESSDPGDEGCQTELFEPGLDPTVSTWSSSAGGGFLQLHLGVPLAGNHSLRLRGRARSRERGIRRQAFEPDTSRFFAFEERRDQTIDLSWVYDSTDDPVFATRGARIQSGVDLRHLEADLRNVDLLSPASPMSAHMETTRIGVLSQGEIFRTFGEHTVSGFGRFLFGRSELDNVLTADLQSLDGDVDTWQAMLGGRYSRPLLMRRAPGSWRELRWSGSARFFHRGTSPALGLADNPQHGFQLGTELAFRATWGLFSLSLEYIDVDR